VVFPQGMIHGVVLVVDRRIIVSMPTTLIGPAAIFPHMDTRRINGQWQVPVQRFLGLENPSETLLICSAVISWVAAPAFN